MEILKIRSKILKKVFFAEDGNIRQVLCNFFDRFGKTLLKEVFQYVLFEFLMEKKPVNLARVANKKRLIWFSVLSVFAARAEVMDIPSVDQIDIEKSSRSEQAATVWFEKEFPERLARFRYHYEPTTEVPLHTPEARLVVGAAFSSDYYGFRRAQTLDANNKDDANDQFRQRTELAAKFGYGSGIRPKIETRISIGNTLFWRPYWQSPVYADPNINFLSKTDKNFLPIKTNFQEAWIIANFEQIFSDKKSLPRNSLKIGYFPYIVGRGISLGDWAQGGVSYMGFRKTGIQTDAPMYPAGILWHAQIGKLGSVDVYYSPDVTEDFFNASDETGKIFVSQIKKENSGRHILSASAQIERSYEKVRAGINPYWVYYNSPRQSIRNTMDGPIDFHTFGFMAEGSACGLKINIEVAKQIGHQTVASSSNKQFPNVGLFDFNDSHKTVDGTYPVVPLSDQTYRMLLRENPSLQNISATVGTDGKIKGLGNLWSAYSADAKDNPDAVYGEYRDSYKIDLSGWMAVMDMHYTCESYPMSLGMAFAYFSGDQYPYNDNTNKFFNTDTKSESSPYHESYYDSYTLPVGSPNVTGLPSGHFVAQGQPLLNGQNATAPTIQNVKRARILPTKDKKYKGFLPLRDHRYLGLWVSPLVMLVAGIVPRPKGLDYYDFVAKSDDDTVTNLIYWGMGFDTTPPQFEGRLKFASNLLFYWVDDAPLKWNKLEKSAPQRLRNSESQGLSSFNINGWEGNSKASSFLGYEINAITNFNITQGLQLSVRGGVFFPGQFYKDIDGMPTDNSIVSNDLKISSSGVTTNKTLYNGLGSDIAYGLYVRLRYLF